MKKMVPELRFPGFSGEWREKKLGEIGEIITGSTPPTLNREYYGGEYLFVSPIDIQDNRYIKKTKNSLTKKGFLKGRKIRLGSTLFVCIGSTIGKVAQNSFDCITNQQINSIVPIENNDNFVFSLLQFHSEKIKMLSAEQAVPIINKTTFSNYNLFLPSFPEQQKIASFLTAVDEKLQALKKKKKLLAQYKKGMIQKIFSQEFRFKDEDGNELPEWEEKKFGEIYSFKITNSFSRECLNYEIGVVKNIHYGDIHTQFEMLFNILKETPPYINPDISLDKIALDNYCQKGDLVIADASEDYLDIGKSIEIINLNNEKVLAGLHTLLARPSKKSMAIGFGGYLMKSEALRLQLMTIAQGTKVLSISIKRLEGINIPRPSLPEQTKIANFLSAIDEKINLCTIQIEKTERYKKGLLQKMFV